MRGSCVGKLRVCSQIEDIVVRSLQAVWGWLSELIDTDSHDLDHSLHTLTLLLTSTSPLVVDVQHQRSARLLVLTSKYRLARYNGLPRRGHLSRDDHNGANKRHRNPQSSTSHIANSPQNDKHVQGVSGNTATSFYPLCVKGIHTMIE